ncbi:MAG: hypothetical protein WCB46_03060 [Methanoregula sp.]
MNGLIVLIIAFIIIIPASAESVDTGVKIKSGGGSPPVVYTTWEQQQIAALEDGDPTHNVAGFQILPPCTFGGKKLIEYYAVVFDEEDNGGVKLTFADISNPDGTFKYSVNFVKVVPRNTGIAKYNAAVAAGLVKVGTGRTTASVLNDLEKGTAAVWRGEAYIDYCQMDGDYTVIVKAIDQNDNYSPELVNTFLYVPVACGEFDFTAFDYGNVSINKNVWRAGDTIFGTTAAPTVRNIGNTRIRIKINQSDMGFGQDVTGAWMVQYDARLGNTGAEPIYNPYTEIVLPDVLDRSHLEELDFSIHVFKGTGSHSGDMTLGVVRG